MASEQVLYEPGDAVLFQAVEVGIFEEIEVPRTADSANLTQDG